MAIPEVMRRFLWDHTFATEHIALIKPTRFRPLRYRDRILKPNPYLTQARIDREELPSDTSWRGYEARPGMADLRPDILERDQYTCQQCGTAVTHRTAEIDHIRPVRRFKRPIDANVEGNLQTLCLPCHDKKTQADRQGESRVR